MFKNIFVSYRSLKQSIYYLYYFPIRRNIFWIWFVIVLYFFYLLLFDEVSHKCKRLKNENTFQSPITSRNHICLDILVRTPGGTYHSHIPSDSCQRGTSSIKRHNYCSQIVSSHDVLIILNKYIDESDSMSFMSNNVEIVLSGFIDDVPIAKKIIAPYKTLRCNRPMVSTLFHKEISYIWAL